VVTDVRIEFKVSCENKRCRYETPLFNSSARAVAHWKLVQKILSRNL
jgi:hypothetical protein